MVNIDKKDELYKYLINLGIEDVDTIYLELANNGRYKLNDVRQYFREIFTPSNKEDVDEKDLEKVLDYYIDLKSVKTLSGQALNKLLTQYTDTKDKTIKEQIINSQLKDVLYLCLNYITLHKDIDIQDLVQIANMGLIDAIEQFKPKSKINFKDYVIYYVRKRIIEESKEKTNG